MGLFTNLAKSTSNLLEIFARVEATEARVIKLQEAQPPQPDAPPARKKRVLSDAHIAKLSQSKKEFYKNLTPERQAEIAAKLSQSMMGKKNAQKPPKPPKPVRIKVQDYTVDDWKAYIQKRVVVDENECWIWQLALNKPTKKHPENGGYGLMSHWDGTERKMRTTHRVAYELWVGPIPAGREICHWPCANKACCNPDHLYAGTHEQNIQDAIASLGQWTPNANKRCYYNDSGTRKFFLEGQQPEGWSITPGAFVPKRNGQGVTGYKWYTSGVKNMLLPPDVPPPTGWQPGFIKFNSTERNKEQHNGV